MKATIGLLLVLGLGCAGVAAEPNALARPVPPGPADLNGRWNGVDLERRTGCVNPQNEGSRGTYAQFDIGVDSTGSFNIAQSGITGLNCSYSGRLQPSGGRLTVQGAYSCTDGKQGTIVSGEVLFHPPSVDVRLSIRLTGAETCAIVSILALARFPP
jgi:hypothetical protein